MDETDLVSSLPQEVLDYMLDMMPWRDMENCSCVCKSWRTKILVSAAWRGKCIREGHKIFPSDEESVDYRRAFYHIKNISETFNSGWFETTKFRSPTDCNLLESRSSISGGNLAYIGNDKSLHVLLFS